MALEGFSMGSWLAGSVIMVTGIVLPLCYRVFMHQLQGSSSSGKGLPTSSKQSEA
jgi:hypothetical protein